MIRVVHVITGLSVGGAELALLRLLAARDSSTQQASVVSLTPGGAVASSLASLGVPVTDVGMTSPLHVPRALLRLRRLLREQPVDVVQTWMPHADLIGGLAARAAGVPVVWGLRMGEMTSVERRSSRAVVAVNSRLSAVLPDAVVACSTSVARVHVGHGYPQNRVIVIPNGYPVLERSGQGERLREQYGIPRQAVVVARVGRWHPMKDYPTFLKAAGPLLGDHPELHLLLVGEGLDAANPALATELRALGHADRVHLLGRRDDMPAVYSATDVLCSSSIAGEGFPNVIAEAMQAGATVVATDVGESAVIIGPHGVVVPPGDPAALREGLRSMLQLPSGERRAIGLRAAEDVRARYSIERMSRAFADLHMRVAEGRTPSGQ